MAEDRMLSDEVLLALIKKNSGGGGGGTNNYNQLENKPQIAGVTLQGNKSLSDLGIASATALGNVSNAVTAITNGQTIDSFGDVETALTSKQNALTAGDYISLNNGNIAVNRNLVGDNYDYEIKSTGDYKLTIIKSQGGTVISTNTYDYSYGTSTNIDNNFTIAGAYSGGNTWVYTALKDSTTHSVGYTWTKSVDASFEETESFPSEDLSGYKLVIKSEMDTALSGKQDTLTFDNVPTDNSNNPVKSNGIYDALELKQNATDNSLETTDKTIVGAINEHEGDIGSLKSGLTNLDTEVNGDATVYPYADVITIPDAIPANLAECNVKIEPVQDLHGFDHPWVGGAGKQIIQLTLDNLKTLNTIGTWADNVYTLNNGTYTVNMDGANNVTSITADGTFSSISSLILANNFPIKTGNYRIADNCTVNLDGGVHTLQIFGLQSAIYVITNSDNEVIVSADATIKIQITIGTATINNAVFTPILYKSETQDPTFAPYTNICPITGHTEVSMQMDGKNWFDKSIIESGDRNKRVSTGNGGTYPADGYTSTKYMEIVGGETYRLSGGGNGFDYYFAIADENRRYIRGGNTTGSFTTIANEKYVKFDYPTNKEDDIQLELGSSATDYEPYSGKTYTIALGDTIYKGLLDVDTGLMTPTHAVVDMGTLSWTKVADGLYRAEQSGMKNTADDEVADMLCETYFPDMYSRLPAGSIALRYTNQIWVRDNTVADATELTTNLNGKKLCYPLGTPVTIQLTPKQIQLLKGTNTITASTGQISVTVNGVSGAIGAVQTQANATDAALAELAADIAEQLPDAPTTDGAYVLTVTVADGTPTYSWESAE